MNHRLRTYWFRAGMVGVALALFAAGCRREVIVPGSELGGTPGTPFTVGGARGAQQLESTGPLIPPTATPTRMPPKTTATEYTVQSGDTMYGIASAYGTTIDSLVQLNGLADADHLAIGQVLKISMDAEHVGPSDPLIPDSELVYGPSFAGFDIAAEVARHPGYLAGYSELVGARELTGAEIVALVAEQYSVGPRLLLAMLELRGGWLSNPTPSPDQQLFPLGYQRGEYWEGLYYQLCQAANALNIGAYGWWLDTLWLVQTGDGAFIQYAPGLNAGTAGVQKMLADTADSYETWLADIRRFREIYTSLFGDPFQYAVEPLIPMNTQAPTMELPWAEDETWYYTGGPHPGWGSDGAGSAIDFVTDEENIGCAVSQRWETAVAAGTIVESQDGMVLEDLDDDGFVGTGWVVLYMHVAAEGRVEIGTHVDVGDPIGHPSCEGGVSDASHLHLARRMNGVWIAADDPAYPMSLSGWTPVRGVEAYEGTLVRGDEVRTVCECWEAINAVKR